MVEEDGAVLRLVAEERRAWHAGRVVWQGETDINAASIGIEIVNPGHEFGYRAFPDAQIAAVIALVDDIRTRWTIADARIIGHSDVAPDRKEDPGELFPWKRLAEAGHGLWFEPAHERIAALGAPLGDRRRGPRASSSCRPACTGWATACSPAATTTRRPRTTVARLPAPLAASRGRRRRRRRDAGDA